MVAVSSSPWKSAAPVSLNSLSAVRNSRSRAMGRSKGIPKPPSTKCLAPRASPRWQRPWVAAWAVWAWLDTRGVAAEDGNGGRPHLEAGHLPPDDPRERGRVRAEALPEPRALQPGGRRLAGELHGGVDLVVGIARVECYSNSHTDANGRRPGPHSVRV
ncbi:hypothetical protein SMICM304S_08081 [Streptomyces microflavus]